MGNYDKSFKLYLEKFRMGIQLTDELRKQSTLILGKALSLEKFVKRTRKKLISKRDSLFQQYAVEEKGQHLKRIKTLTEKFEKVASKKEWIAILINKPLGFQEMAKDFVLYQDDASGSGLITDMEKLLAIDKNATMGTSLPQMKSFFFKWSRSKAI